MSANETTGLLATAKRARQGSESGVGDSGTNSSGSWYEFVTSAFGRKKSKNSQEQAKPRRVPTKIEPKVFFANERTFLAWLHMSVTLSSISVAIIAFADANEWSQVYGLLLLPVAIAFCAYSLWMYIKRAGMIRRKEPGPYEDKVGPLVLAGLLGASLLINFLVKLYDYSV